MGSSRSCLLVVCLTGLGLGACSDSDGDAGARSCAGEDILAVNQNGASEGLAEVVIASGDGVAQPVTGDWVATKPSFSPDGERLVVVRADGDYGSSGPETTSLWIIGVDGSDPRQLTDGPFDDEPDWSPDGKVIAYSSSSGIRGGRLLTVAAAGGAPHPLVDNEGLDDSAPSWSPDGDRVAFIRREPPSELVKTTVWTVDADGSNPMPLALVPGAHGIDWHPDGGTLLVSTLVGGDGRIHLVDIDSGESRQIGDDVTFGAWSPSGDVIYFVTQDGEPPTPSWRLAQGHVVDYRLERDGYVGEIEDYHLYSYLGLAVRPCV